MRLNSYGWGVSDGAPVVCLHGITGHGRRFVHLAERLRTRRVVAFDLRGHGHSRPEPPWDIETHVADLTESADALGIGRATCIGHSFGGRLVAELAARIPERVERAVLLDPAMHIDPAIALERAELMRPDTWFATEDEAIDTRLADPALFTTSRAVIEEEAAAHLERGDDNRFRWRYSPTAVIAAWSEMATPAPAFPSCPTLVVRGARSWIPTDVPDAAHIEVATVPGGHSVLWDDFEATASAVTRFLG